MAVSPKLRVAIVGSGIGGLSLALALSRLGLDDVLEIDIYEATAKLAQVGAGITVWPRAWEILKELGLEAALSACSPPTEAMLKGDPVLAFSYRKSDQREGTPIVDVRIPSGPRPFHRADVQDVLLRHISPSVRSHLSHRLLSYQETANGIDLGFRNGERASCDILVGADGVNSIVRKIFLENGHAPNAERAQPEWTGTTVYRCLIDSEVIKRHSPNHRGLKSPTVYCGKNKHLVMYPVLQGRFLNTMQFVSQPEKEGSCLEGPAMQNATKDDIQAIYDGWEEEVQCVVQHLNRPSRWAIQTVGPLEDYAIGQVILLGDAAHAMPPHLGNGAGQAIEDAYMLANILAKGLLQTNATIPEMTRVYSHIRQPFGNFVVDASRQQGRRYELSTSGLANVKAGDNISSSKLKELGKSIEEGWSWTWKTSVRSDLEKALAML